MLDSLLYVIEEILLQKKRVIYYFLSFLSCYSMFFFVFLIPLVACVWFRVESSCHLLQKNVSFTHFASIESEIFWRSREGTTICFLLWFVNIWWKALNVTGWPVTFDAAALWFFYYLCKKVKAPSFIFLLYLLRLCLWLTYLINSIGNFIYFKLT